MVEFSPATREARVRFPANAGLLFWPLPGRLPQRSCYRSQLLNHTRPAAAKAALKPGAPPCPVSMTSSWILHTCATSWLRGQGPRALQPSGDSCAPPAPASLQQEAVMKPVSCETVLHTTWTGEWGPHSERKPPESHWASCY